MANGNIKIIGLKGLQRKLNKVSKAVPKEASRAINLSLRTVERQVKHNLSNRILRVISGKLHDTWPVVESSARKLSGRIGSNVVYARIHEYGGRAGRGLKVRIPARKYFTKSIKQCEKKINGFFNKAISRIVKA